MTLSFPPLGEAHAAARSATSHFRLPFQRAIRHGLSGNWLGAGVGSSIDFQDHREYLAGDDPRYIDWRAYARTGTYSLKLYREELTPKVDLILDRSSSMFFEPAKASRTLELFYFVIESALRAHASLRCYAIEGGAITPLETEHLLSYEFGLGNQGSLEKRPQIELIPFRAGSLRTLVSDLLYPETPIPILNSLMAMRSQGIIFSPFCISECNPSWHGNTVFVECEDRSSRKQFVNDGVLKQYKTSYERHFQFWNEECQRHQVLLSRIAAEQPFEKALELGALSAGAIELCN